MDNTQTVTLLRRLLVDVVESDNDLTVRDDPFRLHFFLELALKDELLDPYLVLLPPNMGPVNEYTLCLMLRLQYLTAVTKSDLRHWFKTMAIEMLDTTDFEVKDLTEKPWTHFSLKLWLITAEVEEEYLGFGDDRDAFTSCIVEYVLEELDPNLRRAMLFVLSKALLRDPSIHTCKLLAECIEKGFDKRLVSALFGTSANLLKSLTHVFANNTDVELQGLALCCILYLVQFNQSRILRSRRISFFFDTERLMVFGQYLQNLYDSRETGIKYTVFVENDDVVGCKIINLQRINDQAT